MFWERLIGVSPHGMAHQGSFFALKRASFVPRDTLRRETRGRFTPIHPYNNSLYFSSTHLLLTRLI